MHRWWGYKCWRCSRRRLRILWNSVAQVPLINLSEDYYCNQFEVSYFSYLVENILSYSKNEEINSWLKYPKFRLVSQVFIICKSFQYGIPINYDINSIAVRLVNVLLRIQTEFKENFKQLIIQFCGILAYHKIDRETILGILAEIKTKQLYGIAVL